MSDVDTKELDRLLQEAFDTASKLLWLPPMVQEFSSLIRM